MKTKHTICLCGAVLSLSLLPSSTDVYGQTKITPVNNNSNQSTYDVEIDGEIWDVGKLKSRLIQLIDKASEIHGDATFGYGDNEYPIEMGHELMEVVDEATELYRGGSDDEYALEVMINELEAAITKFLGSKIDLGFIKGLLLDAITDITEVYNEAKVGHEIGEYPQEAKDNLLLALEQAEDVYNNPTSNFKDLENAKLALFNAQDMFFRSAITDVDVSFLIAKITEMQILSQELVVGERPDQTPLEAKMEFDKVIAEAQDLIGNCTYAEALSMSEKLDAAKKTLEDAKITYEKINRADLTTQVNIALNLRNNAIVGENNGNYPQSALDELNSALYDAEMALSEKNSTQKEIDAAKDKLELVIESFKSSIIVKDELNFSQLEKFIATAEQLIQNTPVGGDLNQAPASAKDKLSKTLAHCKEVKDSNPLSQSIIDGAASELEEAIDEFKRAIKTELNYTALSSELEKAIEFQGTILASMIGNEVGQYPASAKAELDETIDKAQQLIDVGAKTQKEIDDMTTKLSNTVDAFKLSMIQESVNKEKLEELVLKAEKLLKDSVVGDKDGMYPKDIYDKLSKVTKEARKELDSTESTQSTIDTLITELSSAIEEFLNSEHIDYKTHKENLQLEVNTCVELYNSSKEGYSPGEYPKDVRDTFKKAIDAAKKTLNSNSKSSEDYLTAIDLLLKAKTQYESSTISNEDIEACVIELGKLLEDISKCIKSVDITADEGVSENKKVAISIMYNRISAIVESSDNYAELREGIKLAEYSISDFNDKSIFVDQNNVVNGRKLTGIVASPDKAVNDINILNKTEFIPQAGLPIDVKGALASIGTMFTAIGGVLFRKKQ